LWRGASAIALKAVSSREQPTRRRLLEFLENQYDIELEIQLKEQHFSSKKDFLSRLMNKNKLYSLDGYKMACFDPMTDEELLDFAAAEYSVTSLEQLTREQGLALLQTMKMYPKKEVG